MRISRGSVSIIFPDFISAKKELIRHINEKYTRCDLLRIRNFGKKSIDWMLELLKEKAGVEIE